jgi:soluble lytic murein transglycosylase-like protein
MISWWTGLVLLCTLLAGCGGGKKKALAPPPASSPDFAQEEIAVEPEQSLAEQLSENRLEELLAKSGLHRQDPVLEAELKKWDQTLKIDVPVAKNKEVKAYLVYFTTERKNTIRNYLARSTRYLPMIREVFQEHGLPEDLAYLAMIESGYNPHAYSHAHACGLWQFIQGTGRRYGLAINNYVDERRDPVKATHAAAKYLLDLYKQFGSWYLAAASYNCGENRVQREIDASTHKNFWELSANQRLPNETKNYVPQMIAATIIAKNPDKFGFKNIPYQPRLQYDTIKVNEPTSLKAAAIACNVPAEEIAFLNPELRKGVTPPDQAQYVLKIPKNTTELFARNIQMARMEAPAGASAAVQTARSAARPSYTTKKTSSRKVAGSSSSRKTASRQVASSQSRGQRPAPASRGKAVASSPQRSSVQVASILAGGKPSPAPKASATSRKPASARSSGSVQNSPQKSTKKKVSTQQASPRLAGGKKGQEPTVSSRNSGKKGSQVSKSPQQSKVRIKRKPVQTAAKTHPDSS